jgi:hypothetical protein
MAFEAPADVAGDVDAAVGANGDGVVRRGRATGQDPGRVDVDVEAGVVRPSAQNALGNRRAALVGGAENQDVDPTSLGRPA